MVEAFVEGQDVFVSLPTGSGKSVCYACLPLVFDLLRSQGDHRSIVVVVAPLTALMQDQVASFQARGLTSSCVGVRLDEEVFRDEDAVVRGDIQLIFMNPETLLSDQSWREMFLSPVYQKGLVALAIDEAHLVEKW